MKIEIQGEGHTFCNLLQWALLQDTNVEMAGYDVSHPLVLSAVLYVRTKRESSPEKALARALTKVGEMSNEFLEKLDKALIPS
ncbi:RpoL/Rpb11 RNA polymerase subunit family protein [[Eubacterium] cellulosolvens]